MIEEDKLRAMKRPATIAQNYDGEEAFIVDIAL
jgi:hypothetical protein